MDSQKEMTKAIKHAGKYMKKEQDKILKESKEWKEKCSYCNELNDEFIYAVQIGKQIRRCCLVCYRGTFNDPLLDLFNRDRKLKKEKGLHYGLYISFNK